MLFYIDANSLVSDYFVMSALYYATILSVSLINLNYKSLLSNLIAICVISSIIESTLYLVLDFVKHNNPKYPVSSLITLLDSSVVFSCVAAISLTIALYLRNNILISNKGVRMLTTIFPFLITLSIIGMIATNFSRKLNIYIGFVEARNILILLYSTMSNIYLLLYYQRCYFNSVSTMKHLQFQMFYKRNWVIFATIVNIVCIPLVLTSASGTIAYNSMYVPDLVFLFQLNVLIEFVEFNLSENKIVIGGHVADIVEGFKT